MTKSRVVYEVALNDADYVVAGCPFYNTWKNMLRRCYTEGVRSATYKDVTVCDDWLRFSKFKAWMQAQYWQNMSLDKDILKSGNRVYCPEYCRFVPKFINNLVLVKKSGKSKFGLGVSKDKNKFGAYSKDTSGKTVLLGLYCTPEEAHFAWQLDKVFRIEAAVNRYSNTDGFNTEVAEALIAKAWNLRNTYSKKEEVYTI